MALAQGWLDPDEMLDCMTPALMREWEEFDAIRGIGLERLIHSLALVGSAASGAFSGECVPYERFIPGAEPEPEQDVETQIEICRLMAAKHNASV